MFCRSHISFDSSLISESPFPIHQDSESSVLIFSSQPFSAFLLLISLLSFCFTDISQFSAFLFLPRPFKVAKNPLLLAFALSSTSHSLLILTCFTSFSSFPCKLLSDLTVSSYPVSVFSPLTRYHHLIHVLITCHWRLCCCCCCCCCLKWRGRDAHEVNSKTFP